MRSLRLALAALGLAALCLVPASAVTSLPSADGQFWDIQDTSPWAQDSGGIATGGRANPFNGFGYLKLRVRHASDAAAPPTVTNQYLRGFGLARDGERFDSITPVLHDGVVVARALFAPKDTDYLRYYDSFTNTATDPRVIDVAWGGATGVYEDGGRVAVAATSSGDRVIDGNDSFVTVMQNAHATADPRQGPSGHGPSAHVLGNAPRLAFARAGDMYGDPFTAPYPGFDPAHVGYVFTLTLRPNQTAALVTFVVKGLSEVYDPRGGFPIARRDALLGTWSGPEYTGADKHVPPAGSQIARVTAEAQRLVAAPDLRGLTLRQRLAVVNWSAATLFSGAPPSLPAFSVFEKTVTDLADAMAGGTVTSEDIVRDYLTRATVFDRNGPTFRAILALNPRAIADARARDLERATGRTRGPYHGVPIVLKDNIDTAELPTTGGAWALADHHPRLDSHVAAGMKAGGAVILGKANLDEFPFGDFGISSVGGTVGNAYDPSLSTSGSSGGSATAVATSLAALGFGTDTCNSLSNPSGFASLATIRATRGAMSRAGVIPLNTFNDTVGPMGKTVRDIALALDLVMGVDPEDAVTADAAAHAGPSFAAGLGLATLKGARIGVFRQRFVSITGEREVVETMDRVGRELTAAGAIVVDVAIPDYDAKYGAVRGSAPGSLKAGWEAYLSRGARPGDHVLTIPELIASGKLSPVGQRRLEGALAPTPSGAELQAASERFYAGRLRFRALLVAAMDAERLDAMLYPANQARPATHEGGAERYGSEPGTCEESAATGLPQVTVPAGYLGDRYPVGVSFLGRMWDDRKMLGLAYAYEQATKHRRPPSTVR
ncbi:MAG: amidase family protein [Acidobacteriota bacterium]